MHCQQQANCFPDANSRVLVMQVTTTGSISGQMNYQIFPWAFEGVIERISAEFGWSGHVRSGGGKRVRLHGCLCCEL